MLAHYLISSSSESVYLYVGSTLLSSFSVRMTSSVNASRGGLLRLYLSMADLYLDS